MDTSTWGGARPGAGRRRQYEKVKIPHELHGYDSAQEMLDAIECGELATVLLPDEQRGWAIEWLNEQAKIVENPFLAEALESIARQLWQAVLRERKAEEATTGEE